VIKLDLYSHYSNNKINKIIKEVYYENEFLENYIEEEYPQMWKTDPYMWKTQDGENIPISEMSDVHLVNAIKYLERMASKMAIRRGQQYHNIMTLANRSFSKYIFLLEEAEKRGLISFINELTQTGEIETFRKWVKNKPLQKTTEKQKQQDIQTQIEKKLGAAGHRKIIL